MKPEIKRRWVILVCLALALPIRADFWVDPPPQTPMEWNWSEQPGSPVGAEEARYAVGGAAASGGKPAPKPEGPQGVEGYDKDTEHWEGPKEANTNPTKKLLRSVKAPTPNRLRTADIWMEWPVKRPPAGWGWAKDYGQAVYLPPVPNLFRDKVLTYAFTQKAYPYYVPPRELQWYLTELGWAALAPDIGLLQEGNANLMKVAEGVLPAVTGQGFGNKATAWEAWWKGLEEKPAQLPPPPGPAATLDDFIRTWVRRELGEGYWGDGHLGERLRLHVPLVQDEVARAVGSESFLVRQNAAGWLADLRSPGEREVLRGLLKDKDAVVRIRAWRGLFALSDKAIMTWVDEHLKSPDPLLKSAAVYAAGVMGDRKRAKAVAELLDDPELGDTALMALVRMNDPSQKERLRAIADEWKVKRNDGRHKFRALAAAAGLVRLGDEEGAALLAKALAPRVDRRDGWEFRGPNTAGGAFELGGSSPAPWPEPEATPQMQAFLIDLASRGPTKSWQEVLRGLAAAPPGAAVKSGYGSLFIFDEPKAAAVQNLVLQKGDPLLDLLEKAAVEKGNWYVRASSLARLFEADHERGLALARRVLGREESPALDAKAVSKAQDDVAKEMNVAMGRLGAVRVKVVWPESWGALVAQRNALADQSRRETLPRMDALLRFLASQRASGDSEPLAILQGEVRSFRDALADDNLKDAWNRLLRLRAMVEHAYDGNWGPITSIEKCINIFKDLPPGVQARMEGDLKKVALLVPSWPGYQGNYFDTEPMMGAAKRGDDKDTLKVLNVASWGIFQPFPTDTAIEPVIDTALAIVRQDLKPEDVPVLARMAANPARSDGQRLKLLAALGQPEAASSRPALLALAKDAEAPSLVRQAALLAVARQGEKEAAVALLPFLEDSGDGWVRFAAFVALRHLTGQEHFCDWLLASPEVRAKTVEAWKKAVAP